MNISAPLVAALMDFAALRGIPTSTLTKVLPNRDIDWCSMDSNVAVKDYFTILNIVVNSLNDPYIGIHFGLYLNLSALGIVHQISLQSSTIEQAVLLLMSYTQHHFPLLTIEQQHNADNICLHLSSNNSPTTVQQAILDSSFCLIFRELKLMVPTTPFKLCLPYANNQAYEEALSFPIQKSQYHSIELPRAALNQCLAPNHQKSIALLLPKFLEMLPQELPNSSFSAATRQMILRLCSPELPSLQQVCRQFAMSSRTFQRKLSKEGNSFRNITTAIKKELSTYLQMSHKMKTQDIAYILGYSEASAYLNAKKKWSSS